MEDDLTISDAIVDIMLAMKKRGYRMRELWYAGFLSRQESEDLEIALCKITGDDPEQSSP